MIPTSGGAVEISLDVRPDLLERLRSALRKEREYPREQDLLTYVLLLGFGLFDVERRRRNLEAAGRERREVHAALYRELANLQGAYAAERYAFAEAARDAKVGNIANEGLRRLVFATREHLLPRHRESRGRLLERRDALLRALGEQE